FLTAAVDEDRAPRHSSRPPQLEPRVGPRAGARLRRPPETQLPVGCDESLSQRLRDEWGIVWRNYRDRRSVRERELSLVSRCRGVLRVYVLSSKQQAADLAESI